MRILLRISLTDKWKKRLWQGDTYIHTFHDTYITIFSTRIYLVIYYLRLRQLGPSNTREQWPNKYRSLKLGNLLTRGLHHWCFSVNFEKFLKTSFLQRTSGWLILDLQKVKTVLISAVISVSTNLEREIKPLLV